MVWIVVVWADGDKQRAIEDYPPWTVVRDLDEGTFTWEEGDSRDGTYEVTWLPVEEREAVRAAVGVTPDDF